MAAVTETETEVWEAQTKATVFVRTFDARSREYKMTRVGGPSGPARLRISRADREYNQELIPEENKTKKNNLDPFVNGRLRRVDGASNVGIITDDELREMLKHPPEDLRLLVDEVPDELTVRRLLELAAGYGTMQQVEMLRDVVDERWSVAKSQRTVLEMMQGPEGMGDERIVS